MWRNRDVQWIRNGKLTKGRTNGISETDAFSLVIAGTDLAAWWCCCSVLWKESQIPDGSESLSRVLQESLRSFVVAGVSSVTLVVAGGQLERLGKGWKLGEQPVSIRRVVVSFLFCFFLLSLDF